MDERWWPITLGQFRELDGYLTEHLPLVQKDEPWDGIRYFYEEVLKRRAEYETHGRVGEGGQGSV